MAVVTDVFRVGTITIFSAGVIAADDWWHIIFRLTIFSGGVAV